MEFRKCSVAGVKYGLGFTDAARGAAKRLGKTLPPDHPVDSDDPFWNFYDPALLDNLTKGHETASFIREFLTFLAVCHTVIPERDKTNQNSESFFSSFFLLSSFFLPDQPFSLLEILYQAASPDEAALVSAAKNFGFFFNVRIFHCYFFIFYFIFYFILFYFILFYF